MNTKSTNSTKTNKYSNTSSSKQINAAFNNCNQIINSIDSELKLKHSSSSKSKYYFIHLF